MYYDIVVLGVIISVLFSELTQLSPAGLVVPGYIALNLKSPERIFYTLLIALLTWGIVKLMGNVMILYGRRSFAASILVAFVIDWLVTISGLFLGHPNMIGCLVAGIMAREFERQGFSKSILSLGIVVAILALIMLLIGHPALGL